MFGKKEAPVTAPAPKKAAPKRKTATLDLQVPEGYEVDKSWQVKDITNLKGVLETELAKKNEVFVITVRGARQQKS